MDTDKMGFCRRGKRNAVPHALGKGCILLLWSQNLRKGEYANTMKYKVSTGNVWLAGRPVLHAFESPCPFFGPHGWSSKAT